MDLFADDILMYVKVDGQNDFYLVKRNLGAVNTCFGADLVSLKASKCKYMVTSCWTNKYLPVAELELNCMAHKRVMIFKCVVV